MIEKQKPHREQALQERARFLSIALAVLLGLASAQRALAIEPADKAATPETRNLLTNLDRIRGRQIIFGHHMTTTFHVTGPPAGAPRWSDVKAVTGQWPGMWSFQMDFATRYGQAERMREDIRFAYEMGR